LLAFLVLNNFFVEETLSYFFLEYRVLLFSLLDDGGIVLFFFNRFQELTLHKCLVFGGNLFGGDSIDTIGIIANTNQQGTQQYGHIKAVAFLPPGDIGG
jgi:hypothetical protein